MGVRASKRTEFETCLSHWPAALGLDNLFNFSEYIFSLENRNINILTIYYHILDLQKHSFPFFSFFFSSLLFSSLFSPPISIPSFPFPSPLSRPLPHYKSITKSCQPCILGNGPLLSTPTLINISLTRTHNPVFLPSFPPTLIHPVLCYQLHKDLTPLYKIYNHFPVASKRKTKLLGNTFKALHDLPSTYFSSLFFS